MNRKRQDLIQMLWICCFVSGSVLMLYPFVSNVWNQLHQSRVISSYQEEMENASSEEIIQNRKWAREYNEILYQQKVKEVRNQQEEKAEGCPNDSDGKISWKETPVMQGEDRKRGYQDILRENEAGVMGSIEIPRIAVSLPIYHGTKEEVLQIGVGHMEGYSLPIGGKNTHCVLAGHRGLPSSRLFTDLDELEAGDLFSLHVYGEQLDYEVDQITVAEPDDLSALEIVEGEDYCTLLTCTPYGINTQRLLVRGHRVSHKNREVEGGDTVWKNKKEVYIVCILCFCAVCYLLFCRRKRRAGM